jgi:dinuclear metal center YbgI/SA1388 family protein
MITRTDLVAYIDQLLSPNQFKDYCPNGLQVAGKENIEVLVTGVTASQALIDAAIEMKADAILVHHGYFWRGEDPCITGVKYQRLKSLLMHDMNLLAYHLPLDAHAVLGNNAQLATRLGLLAEGILESVDPAIVHYGSLARAVSLDQFCSQIEMRISRKPMAISGHDRPIKTIGWCTGAAQGYLVNAAEAGLDAFLSGEISEQTTHLARELGIHYIAAGHHATERYGVQALGEAIAETFDVKHHFIDMDNPV